MTSSQEKSFTDPEVRHYIYKTLADTSRPPTTADVARHLSVSLSAVENAFDRLAASHQIALAPGSHSIWMAHPFSGLPTNYVTKIGANKYFGN